MSNFERIPRRAFLERARRRGVRVAMDALAGATIVVDPEPYVGRLAAASPCADTANDAASTSGGSRGVPLFDAAPVPPSNDEATTVKVVEDLAVFAGGAVWCLDWAPARGGAETARHVAVEARAKDDVEHSLGAIGRARGSGLVQVMALRLPAPRATKGKRPRDDPASGPSVDRATARVVLGLAHDAKHAFDLKWRPADVDNERDEPASTLGHLAAALGNGRVEVWRVPSPDTVTKETEKTPLRSDTGSNAVPVVKCAAAFVGVVPPNAGVPLCLDWAPSRPKNRLVAGTSTGAVVLWTLPEDSGDDDTNEGVCPGPALPAMRIASTGCPQRSIRFAPATDRAGPVSKNAFQKYETSDSGFLVLCGGHGMSAPAAFDTRDVFSTTAGGTYSFAGNVATTDVAFAPNGVFLSSRDDGAVDAHDFFFDARMARPRRDTADRVSRRTLTHDEQHPENVVCVFHDRATTRRKGKPALENRKKKNDPASSETFAVEPRLAVDRGTAWSVDVKPAFDFDSDVSGEDVGTALVLAGFGRAGARLCFLNVGNGLRKVTGVRSGKNEARQSGFPVDLTFVGATATFSSAEDAEEDKDASDEEDEPSADGPSLDACLDARLDDATTTDDAMRDKTKSLGVAALLRRLRKKARARVDAARVAAPAHRGKGGFGFVAASALGPNADVASSLHTLAPRYAPVRCVRWLDPQTPVSRFPDRAWFVWGDDAGFVRFQRLCGGAVAVAARGVAETETRN